MILIFFMAILFFSLYYGIRSYKRNKKKKSLMNAYDKRRYRG